MQFVIFLPNHLVLVKQSKLYSNAVDRYNKRSWYEWWTGKSSRFDISRREKALRNREKALDNYNVAAGKYNDLREFIYNKYGTVVTPPLDSIYHYLSKELVRAK